MNIKISTKCRRRYFSALSQDDSNVFMVGDVKQSIYRFRLADPTIFLEKYRNPEKPKKINLSMNFRSRETILEAINYVFREIMSDTLGEMRYTDAEALIPGRSSEKGKQGLQGKQGVEFDIISTATLEDGDEDSPSSIQLEAMHIANKIKRLMEDECYIEEKDGTKRKLRYSDIAIISRTVTGVSWRFAAALSELGIQTDLSGSEDYFSTIEVQAALSLLSVIDNPMQDIPLAAVLCGPVYGFSSDEMVEIRGADNSVNYYEALIRSQEHDTVSSETACKCKAILKELGEMRSLMSDLPTDRFIWHVYNRTGLLNKVMAMKGGKKRKSNLIALAEHAASFEKNGYRGLFSYLNYLEGLKERGADLTDSRDGTAKTACSDEAVKIMSVHKSKGLEFPVVFLANMARRFNRTDLNKSFVFHKSLGVGGTLIDRDRRIRYTTLARDAIVEKLKSEMLSEELRVLYVAMTRAREKLIITAAYSDADKRCEKIRLLASSTGGFSPQALMSLGSPADWLIAGTMKIPTEYAVINRINADDVTGSRATVLSSPLKARQEGETQLPPVKQVSKTQLPAVKQEHEAKPPEQTVEKSFDFIYPFDTSTNLPSKLTVTGLKSIIDVEAERAGFARIEDKHSRAFERKPRFISNESRMSGAQLGTLLHEVMRHIDYNKCSSESDMREDLQRLVKMGFIDERELLEADRQVEKIIGFFRSNIGKQLSKATVREREFRFSLLVSAKVYYSVGGEDKILLQGVIDCFFEENGQIVVIDFKTDRVTKEGISDRAKQYAPQLDTYSKVLERMTGKRVKEKVIYFFAVDTAMSV